MKKFLRAVGLLAGLTILVILVLVALMPWMDRWGATDEELAASLPGDDLVSSPVVTYTRAITVNAAPEEIYPWLLQMGAERGGLYSYSWFETNLLHCELINADRIHEEWQDLKVGDQVKMCPGDFGPRPFAVAEVEPNRALVMGHYENDRWLDTWQFILVPRTDGTTRLILRSRDMKTGGFWDIIRPGVFIMERGMLLGIKERAEQLAETGSTLPLQNVTPTPEVFIPLDKAIPDFRITLAGVHLEIANVTLNGSFPPGCSGEAPACLQAQAGSNILSVAFQPRDLPEGQMLAYKDLPAVGVTLNDGTTVPYSLYKYDNVAHTLLLGFQIPDNASVTGLKWADIEIPVQITP